MPMSKPVTLLVERLAIVFSGCDCIYRSHAWCGAGNNTMKATGSDLTYPCFTWLYNMDRSHFVVLITPCALFLR